MIRIKFRQRGRLSILGKFIFYYADEVLFLTSLSGTVLENNKMRHFFLKYRHQDRTCETKRWGFGRVKVWKIEYLERKPFKCYRHINMNIAKSIRWWLFNVWQSLVRKQTVSNYHIQKQLNRMTIQALETGTTPAVAVQTLTYLHSAFSSMSCLHEHLHIFTQFDIVAFTST